VNYKFHPIRFLFITLGYDKEIRPVLQKDNAVNVAVDLSYVQVSTDSDLDLDHYSNKISLSIFNSIKNQEASNEFGIEFCSF